MIDNSNIIKIFEMHHKYNKYIYEDPCYYTIQLNAEKNSDKDFGYTYKDNTGDNISLKNLTYVDLTGVYWIWKNVNDCKYKGNVHYDRFFVSQDGKILPSCDILSFLKDYDVIVCDFARLEGRTVYQIYNDFHGHENMDTCREVIQDIYPEYLQTFDDVIVNGEYSSLYNIMIGKTEVYNEYCNWLFTILFELEDRLKKLDRLNFTEDDYQRKVFGFIGERLMLVWLKYNKVNYKQVPVNHFDEYLRKDG